MNIQNEIYRRLKMHELLLHSNTGTPEELAQKLHVSKRQLYNLVDEFRAMGASIKYSRESKTLLYKWQEMPFCSQENLISKGKTLLFEIKTISSQSEIFAIIPTKTKLISICKML